MLHITDITPPYTSLLTTGDRYEEDMVEKGIIMAKKGDLKMYQTILKVGSSVRDFKVGDKVMIDPSAYVRRKYSKNSLQNDMDNNPIVEIAFNWIQLEDKNGNVKDCLLITDRDIKFTFEGYETNESIILPDKPNISLN